MKDVVNARQKYIPPQGGLGQSQGLLKLPMNPHPSHAFFLLSIDRIYTTIFKLYLQSTQATVKINRGRRF